jgi:hypothetical protein
MIRFCVLAAIAACGFLCTCSSDSSSDSAKVTATETWTTVMGSSIGSFTLNKLDTGKISMSALWTNGTSNGSAYDDAASGTLALNGTTISSASFGGTAKIIGSTATSSYTCVLTGTIHSGSASGTYTMTFTASGWPSDSGTWTATRSSGSGITP